jgi:hypothetical protein
LYDYIKGDTAFCLDIEEGEEKGVEETRDEGKKTRPTEPTETPDGVKDSVKKV